ncbi:MAG: hypothetical protein KatS3mg028_0682 [Bacteroidia bacterium]|nr:MAG: hypothetical protein KatS3mg028_0682 [Bacteroidia bacterium]
MHRCWVLICLIPFRLLFSQNDTAYERKEGLYLDYIQFRENHPVVKAKIVTSIDTNQLDFFTKVVSQKQIVIASANGGTVAVSPQNLWGYFQNKILYIYYDNAFYKVPVLGAISYFIGTQEVTYYSNVGIGVGYPYGMGGVPVKTREMKDFLLDYYTGKVYPFSIEQLEELFKKDEGIYQQFTQLSRKEKRKKV